MLDQIVPYLENHFPAYRQISIIRNGSIVFEYSNERVYERIASKALKELCFHACKALHKPSLTFVDKIEDKYNLRSVTKSIVALLVGIACDKGLIKSLDDTVCSILCCNIDNNSDMDKISIRHLLKMTV